LHAYAGERDLLVDLAVVGERVDVVVGRDPFRVSEQLALVGEAGALGDLAGEAEGPEPSLPPSSALHAGSMPR